MHVRMQKIKAFTLIELLVVVAIISLLLSIVGPSYRRATEYTRKIICQSQYKQIGVALGTYEAQTGYNFRSHRTASGMSRQDQRSTRHWFFYNGSSDNAHEELPFVFENLTAAGIMPDRKVMFCPGVRNLSHEKNYVYSLVGSGDYTAYSTDDIIARFGMRRIGETDGPFFWSTHTWVWKKELRESISSVNGGSSGAMMLDMVDDIWKFAADSNSRFRNLYDAVGISRSFQHCNVLMQDFSVLNPSDKDAEVIQWLWNSDRWAGTGLAQ